MGSLLRTGRWQGFTLIVILSIAAFGVLSWWQWSRAEERRQDRISIEVSNATPQGIGQESTLDDLPAFTAVTVSGTFDDSHTVLVRNRPLQGSNGLWVMTPMVTDADTATWVLRGWIPAGSSSTGIITPPPAPTGQVDLIAAVRAPENISPRDGFPAGQVPGVNLDIMPDVGMATTANFLQIMNTSALEADVAIVPLPVVDEGQNISYAVQWMLFALVAAVGWVFFLRREAREENDIAIHSSDEDALVVPHVN